MLGRGEKRREEHRGRGRKGEREKGEGEAERRTGGRRKKEEGKERGGSEKGVPTHFPRLLVSHLGEYINLLLESTCASCYPHHFGALRLEMVKLMFTLLTRCFEKTFHVFCEKNWFKIWYGGNRGGKRREEKKGEMEGGLGKRKEEEMEGGT
jgi:hypothetical protein